MVTAPRRRAPLRVAVLGAGYFAAYHLDAWHRLPGAKLVGVCDRNLARARAAVEAFGPIPVFDAPAALLADTAPDLVDIVTPPESHLELVGAIAAAGCDMICQKPLAPSFDEAVRLTVSAESAGVTLIVHENVRFTPWHREMSRVIREGTLGALHNITMRLRPGDGQGAEAYLARQPYFQHMPRFLVHETAIHWIDTFRFLMGEITGLFARLRGLNPAIAGEDAGHIVFGFASGAAGLFDGNRLNEHVSDDARRTLGEMWIEGSRGILRLDGFGRLWLKPHGGDERQHPYRWHDRGFAGDCVLALQAHVVSHYLLGAPLENEARAYLRNLEIEEAVYRSAAEARWIDLSDCRNDSAEGSFA